MEIKAKEIVLFPVSKLTPYEKNANIHTNEQIDKIIDLINFYGHRDPLIVDKNPNKNGLHEVVAGCGRLAAAKKAGWESVPVVFQEFKSEEEKYGFMVSHNAINSFGWGGGLDFSQINQSIIDFGPELDVSMLGIKDFVIEPLDKIELQEPASNNKFILEVKFTNDMDMMDLHDDLVSKGYAVKIKGKK